MTNKADRGMAGARGQSTRRLRLRSWATSALAAALAAGSLGVVLGVVATVSTPGPAGATTTVTSTVNGNTCSGSTWQSVAAPTGVVSATFTLYGAGGAGTYAANGNAGGEGAVVSGTLASVPAGSYLETVLGCGGQSDGSFTNDAGPGGVGYSSGGAGGSSGNENSGGGGGSSGLCLTSTQSTSCSGGTLVAVAGGGGGSGGQGCRNVDGNNCNGSGGAGSAADGLAGASGAGNGPGAGSAVSSENGGQGFGGGGGGAGYGGGGDPPGQGGGGGGGTGGNGGSGTSSACAGAGGGADVGGGGGGSIGPNACTSTYLGAAGANGPSSGTPPVSPGSCTGGTCGTGGAGAAYDLHSNSSSGGGGGGGGGLAGGGGGGDGGGTNQATGDYDGPGAGGGGSSWVNTSSSGGATVSSASFTGTTGYGGLGGTSYNGADSTSTAGYGGSPGSTTGSGNDGSPGFLTITWTIHSTLSVSSGFSSPTCSGSSWTATSAAPAGTVSATFSLYGGGGAGGGGDSTDGDGGEGALVTGTVPISSGQFLESMIGCGGQSDGSFSTTGQLGDGPGGVGYTTGGTGGDYPGGGGATESCTSLSTNCNNAGGGGGSSALCVATSTATPCTGGQVVAIAGGGGGAGAKGCNNSGSCQVGGGGGSAANGAAGATNYNTAGAGSASIGQEDGGVGFGGGGGGSGYGSTGDPAAAGGGGGGGTGGGGASGGGTQNSSSAAAGTDGGAGGGGNAAAGCGGQDASNQDGSFANCGSAITSTPPPVTSSGSGNGSAGAGENASSESGGAGGGGGGLAGGGGGGGAGGDSAASGTYDGAAGGGGGSSWVNTTGAGSVSNYGFTAITGQGAEGTGYNTSGTNGSTAGYGGTPGNDGSAGYVSITWNTVASSAVFTTQPSGGITSTSWAVQPVVTFTNEAGTAVSGDSVAFSIASGPSATLTCSGTGTNGDTFTTNSSGVATATGCSINNAGNYTITATDTSAGSASATSSTFSVVSFSSTSCGSLLSYTIPPGTTSGTLTLTAGGGGGGAGSDTSGYGLKVGAAGAVGGSASDVKYSINSATDPYLDYEIGCGGNGGITFETTASGQAARAGGTGGSGWGSGGAGGASGNTSSGSGFWLASGGGGGGGSYACLSSSPTSCTTANGVPILVAGGGGGGGAVGCAPSTLGVGGAGDAGTVSGSEQYYGTTGTQFAGSGYGGAGGSNGNGATPEGGGGGGGVGTNGGDATDGGGNNAGGTSAGGATNPSGAGAGSSTAGGTGGAGSLASTVSENDDGGGGGGGGYYGGSGGGDDWCGSGGGAGGGGGGSSWGNSSLSGTLSLSGGTGGSAGAGGSGANGNTASTGGAGTIDPAFYGSAPATPSPTTGTFTVGTNSADGTVKFASSTGTSYAETGTLPSGLSFDTTNGSVYGTAASGTGGTYAISVTATNFYGTSTADSITLTVNQAPSITSANSTSFTAGVSGSFTVTTLAGTYPVPTYANTAFAGCSPSSLPTGVSLSTAGVLTSTSSSTLAGSYTLCINATNSVSTATQKFTLTINPAAENQLAFTTEPSATGTAGTALATQPVVSVEDSFGNVVSSGTGSTDSIKLTLSSGTFSTGQSTISVSAVGGVATFSGVQINKAGSYTLTASDSTTTLTAPVSTPATAISPAAPSGVVFTSGPPASGTAGAALSSFTVSVEDSFGNVETGSNTGNNDQVTLSVHSGPGTISSGSTATASGGVATFSSTVFDTAGAYTLTATDTSRSISTATSSSVTISPGAPAQLVITTAPVSGVTGSGNMLGPITVQDQDAYGNLSPATGAGTALTLASSSTGGTFAASSGGSNTTTVNIANGQSQVSFYYGDTTAGSPLLTVSAPGQGSATQNETLTNTLSVTNPGSQSSVSGRAISALQIAASDTSSTATLSYAASGLPAGLMINASTGSITGTPTTACNCSVTITVTDNASYSAQATFAWAVTNTVSVTNPGARSDVSGSAISALDIAAADSSSTATLAYSASGLPVGLSINATSGAITGTPTTACACSVTVTATDNVSGANGGPFSSSATFTWTITNVVSVTNPGTQSAVSGSAISALDISATDSSSTATLAYSAAGLPVGLSIDPASGAITGTPTTACACAVTVTATDNASYQGSASFTWNVTNTVSVTNPGTQSDVSGSAITELDIAASDSSSTATLSYTDSGTLPVGLSINASTGAITGTPTTACTCAVTITATDGASYSGQASFTWNITNTVSVTNPGDQTDVSGSPITELDNSATDSSSVASIASWAATGLPAGLSINAASGAIDGTPTTAGSFPVTLTATDSAGFSGSASFNWTITNTVSVTNPGNQADVSGTAISTLQIVASDTSPTATLSYAAFSLPAGLSINATTGAITGTPTTAGDPTVTVVVDDNADYGGLVRFTWTITNVVSVTNPGNQTSLTGGPITELDISASDSSSTATLSYADNSTLPPGLAINSSTGAITGTPSSDGSYPVTITVTDSASFSATASFTWSIETAPAITSGDNTSFAAGVASSFAVTATGSPAPALSESGALPGGISFSDLGGGSGSLSGTPAPGTAGTYAITITAASVAGSTTQDFTLTIAAAASSSSLTSSVNPAGYQKPVILTDTVSGNSALGSPTGPVTFTDVTGGGDTVICNAVALSAASSTTSSATCSYTPPTSDNQGGTFLVVATYAGDGSYSSSTSNTYSQVVGGELNTLVTLTSSANPTAYGSTVTLTASIYDPAHKGTPSGTVSFFDLTDNTTICNAVTLSPSAAFTSAATCSYTPPAVNNTGGVFSLEDAYSGSTMYGYSNDHQSLTELGNNAATLATPSPSANPLVLGSAVVVSETLSGAAGTPTGKVTYAVNGGPVTCSTGADSQTIISGVATCKFIPAATGTYSVTASYSGDPNYAPGGPSATLDLQVDGSVATTAGTPVLTSPNPGTAGQAVVVTDTVTAASGPTPSGTVNFTATISGVSSSACAGAALNAGVATCSFTPFAGSTGGTVSITATYNGSVDNSPSKASGALAVSVLGTNTLSSFTLSSSANPQASNKAVAITATLSGTNGTPSTTVAFYDDATLISSCGTAGAVKVSAGAAKCSYTPSGSGTHTITASYAGDADYAPQSAPQSLTELIDGTTATTATLSSTANPNAFGSAVTITASMTGSPAPSGTVTFSAKVGATTTVICQSAVVSGGSATCSYDPTLSGPTGQSASITAAYSGDATYVSATPTALTQIEAGTGTIATLALSASPNPAASGKAVALAATITATGSAPSGTVSFYDNGSLIAACGTAGAVKITSGAAHCTYTPSGSGSHAIVAVYSGDVNYAPVTQSTAGYQNSVTETVD